MDGDTAPIESICELTKRLIPEGHCYIIVDEAHSTGVIGSQGKGLVCQKGLEDHIFIRLHTFGKAVHASGSIVICSKITKQYLVNYARPLIYSTAMTFSNLALIKCHYDYLASPEAPLQIETLWERVSYFYHKTNQLATISSGFISLPLPRPQSSIFALICPKSKSLAKFCQDKGVMVRAIVYPTVPKGLERVRVCIHAANTVEDIDFLVSSIEEWLRLEASRSVRL
ncbi:hypothetical protein TRVA0_029S00276 [Trichomonascus vanleenenianus]|uniref:aminotransferase class I/II-fold pyridoxal phosphate-dependent enzyme n=1 Tax=Trichomonascus vanleenenianus TaxID=2268995 RepID=UPI003EC963A6